ncbi:Alpha-aminoadipic semialdehyde synthase-like protein [Dinothrombium tinctorium]|uniref:Alpha-aminoadipic semialdehyde synthase-like protein n=1 Tax=Dinothrombium tinctorium TaxID=1965070 RepID=A0A3S3PQ54_9ACAR|nr:Alpha-aminoadipic semialdehyde synthase-like protein [Dinothrombium tinctorium]RWS12986.1 Alpha-aminoadipic semialdehyde synthase-like protein [Dinothrombium tinctorium]RWS13658.1 Alpha-aminoadipic semialdehyde synthase-like protein [Dinothrombium tinctorium]RWS14242.1 Alpha-aminoadipic semialdehyde synthase-like protein [Dinothrombium tinctorium]
MIWKVTVPAVKLLCHSPESIVQKCSPKWTSFHIFKRLKGTYHYSKSRPSISYDGAKTLAIRREDASIWERRAPLAPSHVRKLTKRGVRVLVQPSNRRAYPSQAYVNAGAVIQEDISDSPVIIGVKQVPIDSLLPNKTYVFFSHTIKAQEDNMPMLDAILERNVRLIDYEKMVGSNGQRVVAFGRYAGIAGMINILHGLGLRLLALGHHTPFMHIGPAHNYRNSGMARQAVRDCGYEIALGMMPRSIGPLTVVLTGSGNVSQGAQEILQELPYEYVDPKDLPQVSQMGSTNKVYASVVSRDDHLFRKDGGRFDMEEFEQHPDRYYSNFATAIAPFASIIINGIYWAVSSPRILTIPDMKRIMQPQNTPWLPSSVGSPSLPHRLLAICDISADPGGSIEFMTECTTIDTPFCLYDADYNKQSEKFSGPGVLVCSIDNMPTQLPLEATEAFGDMLFPYIDDIINSEANKPFEEERMHPVVKGAVIASNGKLTPNFEYIMDLRRMRATEAAGEKSTSILVLGAGYVSSPLVEYLTRDQSLHVTVASALHGQGEAVANKSSNTSSLVLDVTKRPEQLDELISKSDLVISLLPYHFHPMVAKKCIEQKKNMITASYASPEMKALHSAACEAGITIVNEVGLDPGIDHLLAMECFDQVTSNGGKITSFVSYCGGLPAPEHADNPLGYKFSWNPRSVLLNCLKSARWLENGEVKEIPDGGVLMDNAAEVDFLRAFNLEGYPNRDSLIYKDMYGITNAHTVLRGTLRYRGFCDNMKCLLKMGLLDTKPHPSLHPKGPEITWKQFMCTLLGQKEDILPINLRNLVLERVEGHESRLAALETLGLLDDKLIEKLGSPFETLTNYLAQRLAFRGKEQDLVIMRHNIGIEWPNGSKEVRDINLVVYGDPNGYSAMAKTVGYPAAIAAKMLLEEEIQKRGIVLPMTTEIYSPMLKRLQKEGICSIEKSTKL